MPRAIKTSIEVICAILYGGIRRLLGRGPCRVVLLYHGVGAAHLADFRKQMAYLAENCSVVKPSQIVAGDGTDTKPVVALTFDDALISVLENVLPILKEYGMPTGIFVPTGYLGRRPGWVMYGECPDDGDTVMTDQQIAALDREGFEILSHTVSHPVLADLDDRGLEAELAGSRRRLEEIVAHRIGGISYPYGACDARVIRAAQQAGYEIGFTVEPDAVGRATDRLQIGRFEITPCETFIQFKLKVAGAYHAAAYLRRLKAILLRSRRR